jgi:NAD(P)-dependent dehydrogenase (short-subunit alcohol dehydrogenase family)
VAGYWLARRDPGDDRVMAEHDPTHEPKVWFITGTSRGLGRVWAEAALERGDRVVATARNTDQLDGLVARYPDSVLPLAFDVTDPTAAQAAVRRGHRHFGRLDIVVNNAGYGLFGAVEEVTEPQARAQLETNLLGPLWVTQAALPFLRAQGGGHIIQVSSIGGVAAFPLLGLYNASKWGLEGLTEALAQEVAPAGIHVTLVEPGPYGTDWGGSSAVWAEPLPEYDQFRTARRAAAARQQPIDPKVTAKAILTLVDTAEPPLRLFLGSYPYPIAERAYAHRLDSWHEWRHLAATADP